MFDRLFIKRKLKRWEKAIFSVTFLLIFAKIALATFYLFYPANNSKASEDEIMQEDNVVIEEISDYNPISPSENDYLPITENEIVNNDYSSPKIFPLIVEEPKAEPDKVVENLNDNQPDIKDNILPIVSPPAINDNVNDLENNQADAYEKIVAPLLDLLGLEDKDEVACDVESPLFIMVGQNQAYKIVLKNTVMPGSFKLIKDENLQNVVIDFEDREYQLGETVTVNVNIANKFESNIFETKLRAELKYQNGEKTVSSCILKAMVVR